MASLHSNLTSPNFLPPKPNPKTLTRTPTAVILSVRCGPRSNRGPLVKGRILSTEAIIAVQSLKRAYNKSISSLEPPNLPNLTRLIKSDLLSVLRELLRQDLCALALHVLSTLRSEYPDQIDLNLYADVISALSRNGLFDQIDCLIGDLEKAESGIRWESDKGLLRMLRGVVEAGRRESAVRICWMMRRSGCGDTWTADEYVVKVMSKGLRSLDERKLASEVEREFGGVYWDNLKKLGV